jgi:hypothetical protein
MNNIRKVFDHSVHTKDNSIIEFIVCDRNWFGENQEEENKTLYIVAFQAEGVILLYC